MNINSIAANQTEIETNNGTRVFFSYKTPVAAFVPGTGYIRSEEYYSKTTSSHINKWLDGVESAKVPQSEINKLI